MGQFYTKPKLTPIKLQPAPKPPTMPPTKPPTKAPLPTQPPTTTPAPTEPPGDTKTPVLSGSSLSSNYYFNMKGDPNVMYTAETDVDTNVPDEFRDNKTYKFMMDTQQRDTGIMKLGAAFMDRQRFRDMALTKNMSFDYKVYAWVHYNKWSDFLRQSSIAGQDVANDPSFSFSSKVMDLVMEDKVLLPLDAVMRMKKAGVLTASEIGPLVFFKDDGRDTITEKMTAGGNAGILILVILLLAAMAYLYKRKMRRNQSGFEMRENRFAYA